jgi:hypothetical protein
MQAKNLLKRVKGRSAPGSVGRWSGLRLVLVHSLSAAANKSP